MATRLGEFVYEETLSKGTLSKSVCVLGSIAGEAAIVTISRAQVPELPPLPIEQFHLLDENDIYSWGVATLVQDLDKHPGAKVDVIFPATETHIAKYRESPSRLVVETPEMYEQKIVPYIEGMRGSRLDWVRGILFRGVEADRVLYRDDDLTTGFVVLPNSKWDRKSLDSLYLLVLVMREDLLSIRDLNSSHIPFLTHIKTKIIEVVHHQFGLDRTQLKLYFHYQPSYYHLHIHVANVNMQQMDFGRSVLIDNVIDMLASTGPKGLTDATLSYITSEGSDIWRLLKSGESGDPENH